MPERELLVRIVGDDRSLQQAFARSSAGAQQFETRTASLGRNVSRGFAAAGVTIGLGVALQVGKQVTDMASDLNEEITKSQKVFGDSADEILAWSETTASSMGIAQTQALQATGIFGNLFSTVGLGTDQSAEMSQSLTQLAADLASFNNADISDVLLAIRSGLIGEAEPLRRYGVLLSEARVQQVALENTGKQNVRQLSDQEKALARYQIILEDTVPAQGDFADTIGDALLIRRAAAAETQELATEFGKLTLALELATLPVIVGLVGGINDLIDATRDLRGRLHDSDFAEGFNQGVDRAAQHASDFFLGLRDGIPFLQQFKSEVQGIFGETAPGDTIGGGQDSAPHSFPGAGRANAEERRVEAEQAAARRRLENARDRFAAFTKGLGLKLKNAGITETLSDDLAVMREIEAAIQREIAIEGRTFKLANDLADIRLRIAQTTKQQEDRVAAAERDAADAAENARDARQARLQAQHDARERQQFLALGLTAEGEARTPGIAALRNRGRNLLAQIEASGLDTPQIQQFVRQISAVFTDQFDKAGRDVRQAILGLFNTISSALNDGADGVNKGPRTKFRVVNTSNILSGLGLSEDEEKALRSRLSRIGAGGTTPAPGGAGGAFGFDTGTGGRIVINGNVTVVTDDPDHFGRDLEKAARRSGKPRTGAFAGHKN